MNIEELYNDVERDLKIDDTELDLESIRTPQIHNKYLKLYTKHSLQYKKLQDDYKVMYRAKWEYYTGKASPDVYRDNPFDLKVLKNDLQMYINSDEDIIELEKKVVYYETIVEFIDGVIKSIDNRGWDIRNAQDWKKFLAGGF